ncbi:hypothetical protein ACO1O0_007568 [Amphichorda felina]
MKFPVAPTLAAATLIAGVAADFQIYYEEELIADTSGGNVVTSIRIFDGEPSCDDVSSSPSLPDAADASSPGYSRCEGCEDMKDIKTWDIETLELHSSGDWGHFTMYEAEGYKLTPAGGGPLQGECTRDSGDDYDCTLAVANMHGTRLFTCKSPLDGMHAK